jgi:hypothetical protein
VGGSGSAGSIQPDERHNNSSPTLRWNLENIGEGDTEIELFFRDHNREPNVQTIPKEKAQMRDRKYREANVEAVRARNRKNMKRKRADDKKKEDEEKPSKKPKN